MKLEAWQILSMTAIQKQELVDALTECVSVLTDHIDNEAKREGVTAVDLCPCTTTTIARAKKILAKVTA